MANDLNIVFRLLGTEEVTSQTANVRREFAGVKARGEDAGEGAGKAAKGLNQINDSAKTAATSLLGQLSPEMASLANISTDVFKGFTQINTALLGTLGIGAGVGLLIELYRSWADELERVRKQQEAVAEAQRQQRDEGLGLQGELAAFLQARGIAGGAQQGVRDLLQLNNLAGPGAALPEDLGQLAVFLRQRFGAGDDAIRQTLAGFVASGRPDDAFAGQSAAQQQVTLDRLLQRGAQPGAQAALEAVIRDEGEAALRAALTGFAQDTRATLIDSLTDRIAREQGQELNADDRLKIRSIVDAGGLPDPTASEVRDIFSDRINPLEEAAAAAPDLLRGQFAADRTIAQRLLGQIETDAKGGLETNALLSIGREIVERLKAIEEAQRQRPAGPVNIGTLIAPTDFVDVNTFTYENDPMISIPGGG